MAETTTGATTDDRRPRHSVRLSVRTRVTAVVTLLTMGAMAGAGALVLTLETRRIETTTRAEIEQELAEFRRLRRGVDPSTGRPFTDAASLLQLYLRRNVPPSGEMLVTYTDGRLLEWTRNSHASTLLSDPAYGDEVQRLLGEGGNARLDVPGIGEVWLAVVTVTDHRGTGDLVVVSFVQHAKDALATTMRTYVVVSVLALGLIIAVAALQSGRLLAPLRTLRHAAAEISTSDLSRRIPEQGNDDVTRLTETFNAMLARLEDGVETQRRFLDDAGHELRTPLTILSGHLEVLDATNPSEVERTRELLLDETERMSRLVEDLVTLAKSRRPDTLNVRSTDVASLVRDAYDKATPTADRRWTLETTPTRPVAGDPQRLTQALLQLVDNAIKHTGPADGIALGADDRGDHVRCWVRDTGPGIPASDAERVFERFGRSTVDAHDPGFGLGLSIVQAIAESHGGTVELHHEVPHGACLIINLPRHTPLQA